MKLTSGSPKASPLRRALTACIWAVTVSCAKPALARPCSDVSIDQALNQATLVVKGWVESTRPSNLFEGNSTSVIRVDRVLKGATSRAQISVSHFLCGLEYEAAMRPASPVIGFVTASGALVAGTAVLPASRQSAAPLSGDAKSDLRAELVLGSTDRDPAVARASLGALAEIDGPDAAAALKRASGNPDFGIRVRALTWLMRFDDLEAFRRIAEMLFASPFTPKAIPTTIRNDNDAALAIAYNDVRSALSRFSERAFGVSTAPPVHTADFVETMVSVTRSSDPYIRRAAFEALRGFKHRASFPTLIGALGDQDAYVRYHAMFTLCMTMKAPDLPCPSVDSFRFNEQKYVGRIRAWWSAQQ